MKVAGILLATFIHYCVCFAANAQAIRWITPNPDRPRQVIVEVTGFDKLNIAPAQFQKSLIVRVDRDTAADSPMLGMYRSEGGSLKFEPRFPLEPGLRYKAILHLNGIESSSAVFELPVVKQTSQTVVSQVYPSGDIVPENLLKFYVHFSAPMRRGDIYDYIHLRSEQTGKDVELPFIQLEEELWNPAMTRVTLLFDPGRIKRGVRPLEDIGPALEEGGKFSLIIDRAWKDSTGNELKERFEKRFTVGPADRMPIVPSKWRIASPQAESRQSVTIYFSESLDHALAMRMVRLVDAAGAEVLGQASLEDRERRWNFTPSSNWKSGSYKVVVAATIEDLAGNNIGKAFDVDVHADAQTQISDENVILGFEISK